MFLIVRRFLFFIFPLRQIGNEEQEGHGFQSHPRKHLTQAWYRFLWHWTLAETHNSAVSL